MEDFGLTQAIELWKSDAAPFTPSSDGDPALGDWQLEPPPGGRSSGSLLISPASRFQFTQRQRLTMSWCSQVKLVLLVGDEEIVLQAGDTVVQQATPHGWANRSSEPCTVAAVLLSTNVES